MRAHLKERVDVGAMIVMCMWSEEKWWYWKEMIEIQDIAKPLIGKRDT